MCVLVDVSVIFDPPVRRVSSCDRRARQNSSLRGTINCMSGADIGLAVSVFLACAVEAVEALTIVLAVGTTRSWRSALAGGGAATVALAAIVIALGTALTS